MRGALRLPLGLTLLAGCSELLIVPNDDTSSSTAVAGPAVATSVGAGAGDVTGGGGAGGGPAVAHEIEIAVDGEADERLLVLLNEPDGTLVASWFGNELPVQPTVLDGQTVTFASIMGDGTEYVEARRVTPEVTRIEAPGTLPEAPCVEETMQVTVYMPPMGTSQMAELHLSTGGHAHLDELPGVLSVPAFRCSPAVTKVDALLTVGWYSFEAFELFQDIPFVPGSVVELTPTFPNEPRSAMTIDVLPGAEATVTGATIAWRGAPRYTPPLSGGLVAYERDLDGSSMGNTPFTYAPYAIDLPHGFQDVHVRVTYPPNDAACDRSAYLRRMGRSEQAIAYDAAALREPALEGDGFTLGGGELGQVIWRYAHDEATYWSLMDDPARPPLPMVFPQFPDVLPDGFEVPAVPPAPTGIQHRRSSGVASYAEAVASAKDPLPATLESRVSNLTCR